ncbi:MAG TPA: HD domain-containing protein [Candidatus Saccharimonadales bacterium]|nr:HD domain-containing protein [Candidatus Saccharimonadales bacterium]
MILPTDKQIETLHRKYAPSEAAFTLIYTHCQIIDAIATYLLASQSIDLDRQLVHVGCLLHDIGVYPLIDEEGHIRRGITHGVEGESILKKEGFPEAIWRFAAHHTGVGLTEQDVTDQKLPIPMADYTAQTDEERLVMYADKFHSKSNPPVEPPYFCTFDWYRDSVRQFGEDKIAKFDHLAELFGKPDLTQLAAQFGHEIRDIKQD